MDHLQTLQRSLKLRKNWYGYPPELVAEAKDVTILWSLPMRTDRNINVNKPGIRVKNY